MKIAVSCCLQVLVIMQPLCDSLYFCLPSDQDWSSLSIRTSGQIQPAHEVCIHNMISIHVCVCREIHVNITYTTYATFIFLFFFPPLFHPPLSHSSACSAFLSLFFLNSASSQDRGRVGWPGPLCWAQLSQPQCPLSASTGSSGTKKTQELRIYTNM